jgi:chemotaxis protein methyltransferase CheR
MYDYEWFKTQVYEISGINLSYYKEKQMKRRIDALISKHNIENYEAFIGVIRTNKAMYNEFINYLTINVSEFYRNPEQWETLKNEIIPMLLKNSRSLRIWSAACSTGDEPYTLVMILSKFLPLSDIRIIATDIDREVLEKAKKGVYSAKSLENLPKEYLEQYFDKVNDMYAIKTEVKRCIEFRHHNLLADEFPKDMDLIVCRNVLIYFTEEAKSEIYTRFNKSLKSYGVLFVGSTEQIILSNKYNFKASKTFFYTKENQTG